MGRIRFQTGSVFKNKSGKAWQGFYSLPEIQPDGSIKRKNVQKFLAWVKNPDGTATTKKEARALLQPYVDFANASFNSAAKKCQRIKFTHLVDQWLEKQLPSKKLSTQASMRGHVKRLKTFFENRDLDTISRRDFQLFIDSLVGEGKQRPTIKNYLVTLALILKYAYAREYLEHEFTGIKFSKAGHRPKRPRVTVRQVQNLMKSGTQYAGDRVLYQLFAETGIRAGEAAGLMLDDVFEDRIVIRRAVWNGKIITPKTVGSERHIAISSDLYWSLAEIVEWVHDEKWEYVFSRTGAPLDMNTFRHRTFHPLLRKLEIPQMGFHSFRRFNADLMKVAGVSEKTRADRLGHSTVGDITNDVYTSSNWAENVIAAQRLNGLIYQNIDSVSLIPIKQEGPPVPVPGSPELATA